MPKEKRNGSEKPAKNKKQQLQNDTVTLINGKSKSNDKKKSKKSSSSTSSSSTSHQTTINLSKQISHNKSLSEPGFIKTDNQRLTNEANNSSAASSSLPISNIASSSSLAEYSTNLMPNNLNSTKALLPLSPDSNGSVRTGSRSNDKFHQLFPSVPLGETVVDSK